MGTLLRCGRTCISTEGSGWGDVRKNPQISQLAG